VHRQLGRLLALENPAAIDADLTERIGNIGSVADQAPGRDELSIRAIAGTAWRTVSAAS
jgi:hypothetical protein